jgi:hypothetical protein
MESRIFTSDNDYFELNEDETLYFLFCVRQKTVPYLDGDERFERTFDLSQLTKQFISALARKSDLKVDYYE